MTSVPRCQHATEICERGPATEWREGKRCCVICAREYDKAVDEIERERAGDWRAK